MPFIVPIDQARAQFPNFTFIQALTPSEQKAAFHVTDADGTNLCLKIISPDYNIDRLHREIQALQSIEHPNVVALREYTFSSKPGEQTHYMVEAFVQGTDLTDQLDGNPWEPARAMAFFKQLASGLQALSAVNVVHRDLKPANVRVRDDGTPVIIDFGLARHLTLPDLTNTAQGAAIGTPSYFAPEQFDGTKRDIDQRTDLFSLGVMLFQALTGNHPFVQPGMSYQDLRDAVCEGDEHWNDGTYQQLPNRLALIVRRLLAKDRASRPASPELVIRLLEKVGDTQ